MKRLISVLMALAMILSAVSVFASATPMEDGTHGYQLGDVDDDTRVLLKDLLLVKKYLSSLAEEKDISLLAGDFDGDGFITFQDLLALKRVLSGLADLPLNNEDGSYKVGKVTVGGRNISRYSIVLTDPENKCMENSARKLRYYVSSACGITLNTTADDGIGTYKIRYSFDTEDKYELGKEGYHIELDENGDLQIICGTRRGAWYATYYIIEDILGYRILFGDPSKVGRLEYLYAADSVAIPEAFSETAVPYLEYRCIAQGGNNETNYGAMKTNSRGGEEYGWSEDTTLFIHAHSYAYQDKGFGVDITTADEQSQPCLTNTEFYDKVIDYSVQLIEQRKTWGQRMGYEWSQISCSPNDNINFCKCEACKGIYLKEGSIAGTVFRLSNRVAEKLDELYPGIEIYTIAYWDARNPPKFTRPRDNICVCFCFGGCNNHTYDDTDACVEAGGNFRLQSQTWDGQNRNQSNAIDIGYFNRWAELTDNLQVWYYSANFIYYMSPSPNIFNIYEDFRYICSTGASGFYSEGSSRPYASFEYLRGHLAGKMMWNPFMSEEEFETILNEYLMLYYGDGWEYVREYLEMSNEAGDLMGCWTNNFEFPWDMYSKQYFETNYLKMAELFDKAYAAAQDDTRRFRVSLLRIHCDFLGLSATYERDYVNGSDEARGKWVSNYQAMYDIICAEQLQLSAVSDGTKKYDANGEMNSGCTNFPKSRDDIIDPMLWYFDDFTGTRVETK